MLFKNYSTIDQFYRTAGHNLTRESRSTFDMYQAGKITNFTPDRPNTSFFLVHRLNTAAPPKSVQFADKSDIESVQHDLEASLKPDLTNYLHKKFRNFLVRKHDSNPSKPTFVTLNNPEMLNAFCSKMEVSVQLDSQEHSTTKILKPHRTIETAYLLNAKQRISRLVEMKRERQSSFCKLRQTIKEKCKRKKKKFGVLGPQVLYTNKDKQINQNLRNEYQHIVERYRERLWSRSKGKKPDMVQMNQ